MTPRIRRAGHVHGAAPDDTGAAAVEFAIVSVILLILVFGILQYGFTFFQVSSAERTAAEAAHLVRTGQVTSCTDWQTDVGALSTVLGLDPARSHWDRADGAAAPIRNGTMVTVSIVWNPVNVSGGLVPNLGDGPITTSVQSTVTAVGDNPLYTDASGVVGCPDPGP